MPKNINYWTRIDVVGSSIGKREMGVDRREYGELNYQERVAVIWIEKVKAVDSCTLDGVERGRGSAEERVILADMSNIGMFKRVDKTASKVPIKVIVPDVGTLGNRNCNRGRMVGVVRHTLGRRDSCRW